MSHCRATVEPLGAGGQCPDGASESLSNTILSPHNTALCDTQDFPQSHFEALQSHCRFSLCRLAGERGSEVPCSQWLCSCIVLGRAGVLVSCSHFRARAPHQHSNRNTHKSSGTSSEVTAAQLHCLCCRPCGCGCCCVLRTLAPSQHGTTREQSSVNFGTEGDMPHAKVQAHLHLDTQSARRPPSIAIVKKKAATAWDGPEARTGAASTTAT